MNLNNAVCVCVRVRVHACACVFVFLFQLLDYRFLYVSICGGIGFHLSLGVDTLGQCHHICVF